MSILFGFAGRIGRLGYFLMSLAVCIVASMLVGLIIGLMAPHYSDFGLHNIPTPIVKDDYVFASTGYGAGAALLQLKPKNGGVAAHEVYFLPGNKVQNHHGGMVMVGRLTSGALLGTLMTETVPEP